MKNGSEKQIRWAKDIKAGIDFAELEKQFAGNTPAIKVLDYIKNISFAPFWIDHRDSTALSLLREIAGTGLRIKGDGFSNLVKADPAAKMIETWTEIIPDGKGGYKKEFSREI